MKRIQRKRSKGWKMHENCKYVGRPGPWGNIFQVVEMERYHGRKETPYTVWRVVLRERSKHAESILTSTCRYSYATKQLAQAAAVECYRKYHGIHPGEPPNLAGQLFMESVRMELSKYDSLCCWCAEGEPCHADVLVEIVKEGPKEFYRE